MAVFTKDFITFFKGLGKNNNREWFQEHKKDYENHVKEPFNEFLREAIAGVQKFDDEVNIEPKDAAFRIYRDIRFSKDKTPYKDHVGAVISREGRKGKDYPGFYTHISASSVWIGGGAYFLEKEKLRKVRQEIVYHHDEFSKLINDKNFKAKFGELQGDKNKIIPKEFKADLEKEPLIANKQFYYMATLAVEEIVKDDFVQKMVDYMKAGHKFNLFLRRAMS